MIKNIQRSLLTITLCIGAVTTLQGCVEMAVGTAVIGTLAATDRRTIGAQTEDKSIVLKGELRVAEIVGEKGHVNVNSFNRKILLTGEVKDQQMKEAVGRAVSGVEGVQSVVNELEVMGISSYTSRSNDTFITGKVKARLVEAKDIYANTFKVVTERGVVYLMGRVSQREAGIASEAARAVGGVQKVVKVFEYISEAEVKKFSENPASPTNSSNSTNLSNSSHSSNQ